MKLSTVRKPGLVVATAAASAMVAVGVPLALAAPTAIPPSDGQGYVDSTARCTKPDSAVIFGTTDTSRVAICQTASGSFEYRGVRVRDGAKLVTSATRTSVDTFVASNDGVTYTVTPTALSVTVSGNTIRTESWNDFHNPQSPAGTATGSSTPATSSAKPSTSAAPTTSGSASAPATAASAPATAASAPAKPSAAASSSAVPLPPPLPAEVGGGSSATR